MDIIKNYITIPFAKIQIVTLMIYDLLSKPSTYSRLIFLPKNIFIYYHAYARLRLKENCQLGS